MKYDHKTNLDEASLFFGSLSFSAIRMTAKAINPGHNRRR